MKNLAQELRVRTLKLNQGKHKVKMGSVARSTSDHLLLMFIPQSFPSTFHMFFVICVVVKEA